MQQQFLTWSPPEDETYKLHPNDDGGPVRPIKLPYQYELHVLFWIICALCYFINDFKDGYMLILALAISLLTEKFLPPHFVTMLCKFLQATSIVTLVLTGLKFQPNHIITGILKVILIFFVQVIYDMSRASKLERKIRKIVKKLKKKYTRENYDAYCEVRDKLWTKRRTYLMLSCIFLFVAVYFLLIEWSWSWKGEKDDMSIIRDDIKIIEKQLIELKMMKNQLTEVLKKMS